MLGWFYDTFEHPQRLKLLYSAVAFFKVTGAAIWPRPPPAPGA
jgi:hypothetical protein